MVREAGRDDLQADGHAFRTDSHRHRHGRLTGEVELDGVHRDGGVVGDRAGVLGSGPSGAHDVTFKVGVTSTASPTSSCSTRAATS